MTHPYPRSRHVFPASRWEMYSRDRIEYQHALQKSGFRSDQNKTWVCSCVFFCQLGTPFRGWFEGEPKRQPKLLCLGGAFLGSLTGKPNKKGNFLVQAPLCEGNLRDVALVDPIKVDQPEIKRSSVQLLKGIQSRSHMRRVKDIMNRFYTICRVLQSLLQFAWTAPLKSDALAQYP